MKRILFLLLGLVLVFALITLATSLKRVPEGYESLRASHSGELTLYRSGYHLIPPGAAAYLVYPVGVVHYRYPPTGATAVMTEGGEEVAVAFEFDVEVPAGSSRELYGRFSENFDDAMARLIQAAAEMEAARFPRNGDPQWYLDAVAASVREELSHVGLTVSSYALPMWGDADVSAAWEASDVPSRPPRKLIIIGVDGGDWLNLRPLIDRGELPNFRRLIEEGTTGPLRSMEPMLSPLLWTTMATGKYPEDHGILNFTIVDEKTGKKVPVTRHYRKVDAFWNTLGDYGRRVAVVGWMATDPAEQVNGVMVTDGIGYVAFAPEDRESDISGSIYPADRAEEIENLIVHGNSVAFEDCERIIHIDREEFDRHSSVEFDPKDPINNLILMYASTLTFRNVGLHLLENDRPDLLAVYFEWVDAISHLFMLHAPPRLPEINEEEYRKFKDAIQQTYVIQDEILGEFMDRMDDETVLMVISDHGFKSGDSRLRNRPEIWGGEAAAWHRMNGIAALYGKGIKRGGLLVNASILDVTPTVLALQGLPKAADMPGRVWKEALEPELEDGLNEIVVATLERERDEEPGRPESAASEAAMKKLEALGYLTPDNADSHNNLGQRYQERGDYRKAIEEYNKAIAMRPNFYSAYNNIAVCYGKLERYQEAEQALLKAIELQPRDFYAMNNLAVTYIRTGHMEDARRFAERSVEVEPGYANGHITLGSIYAMTGELEKAEREYQLALKLEPGDAGAAENLRRVRQQIRKGQDEPKD